MRRVRSTGKNIKYTEYLDYQATLKIVQNIAAEDSEMANLVHLSPKTSGNNSIVALELHSDVRGKKPGILVIASNLPQIFYLLIIKS